ncbi:methylated-DNA--[protein]-cysteine S-methyltransferase [Synechococcus sp. PCC 7336]|uniref:methylated-DNA--[protein]-cysteine S-methyltransferase n=1 Tax=Synechococcus sp. PCC 7336 TaxID=195250 RepID=UPI0003465081|nr:methylated-DNA--[protein]-cysteine S-methyltransferase [Synechococcus sp. PCC 7336]
MSPIANPNLQNDSDYERIARAIAFVRENHLSQPDLATVARQVHLSQHHFQKVFTRWVGISPKKFLQYLTIEYAKSKLAETQNLFDLAIDAGLSGSGRLHELFVTIEAMSPGEFKAAGKDLQIRYGIHPTPFGQAAIATTDRGICKLSFLGDRAPTEAEQLLQREWSQAEIVYDRQSTQAIADSIFDLGQLGQQKPLTLLVKGTNFQLQVWRALLKIPFGSLATYQTIANAIDRPTATRAIGNAVGHNPIAYLIPCHRVIRASGALSGYRWGVDRKAALLGWEAAQLSKIEETA